MIHKKQGANYSNSNSRGTRGAERPLSGNTYNQDVNGMFPDMTMKSINVSNDEKISRNKPDN
jgi:hypothetical protein